MSIIVVISFLEDFLMCCSGTIIQQLKNDNKVILLIIRKQKSPKFQLNINEIEKYIKLTKVEIIQNLDLKRITQDNVNNIQNFIEKYNPDLVIIPSYKAKNTERGIVGGSSVLSCRKISNILMYDVEENPLFVPTVFYNITNNIKKKQQVISYIKNVKIKKNFMKLTKSLHKKTRITDYNKKFFESYQSLRIIIDSDVMRNLLR